MYVDTFAKADIVLLSCLFFFRPESYCQSSLSLQAGLFILVQQLSGRELAYTLWTVPVDVSPVLQNGIQSS